MELSWHLCPGHVLSLWNWTAMAWMLGSCFLTVAKYRLCCTTVEWYSKDINAQVPFSYCGTNPGRVLPLFFCPQERWLQSFITPMAPLYCAGWSIIILPGHMNTDFHTYTRWRAVLASSLFSSSELRQLSKGGRERFSSAAARSGCFQRIGLSSPRKERERVFVRDPPPTLLKAASFRGPTLCPVNSESLSAKSPPLGDRRDGPRRFRPGEMDPDT